MRSTHLSLTFALFGSLAFAACGGGSSDDTGDDTGDDATTPDGDTGCQPATVLPTAYRPIAEISEGAVAVTTAGGITSGTIDATAGGLSGAADNPYIYIDLRSGGMKVAVDDVDALTSTEWDVALKRSSLRANGGDSGPGNRRIAVVADAVLADVTAAPADGYTTDDFADANCELVTIPGGEPMSAFGEWYLYDEATHEVTPKPDVYVLERNNGSHVAFRVVTYYGDETMPMRGAYYQVEWKDL
jgi:hypothetical protein